MKPTINSQPSRQQNFPLTDYNYQSTLQDSRATVTEARDTQTLRGFWKLSGDYFLSSEAKLSHVAEITLFTIITALSASQIFSMVVAVARLWTNS